MTSYERAQRAYRKWEGAPVTDLFRLIAQEIDDAVAEVAKKKRRVRPAGTCPQCRGKGGWETDSHSGDCPMCNGKGVVA